MSDPIDPFDALVLPPTPLAPDPAFAARLRRQLASALAEGDDRGGTMDDTTTRTDVPDARTGARPTISAYLAVADARAAVAWYVDALGGVAGDTVEMPDGRLGHAEIRIGDSTLMLADEFPELDLLAPPARGGTTVSLVLDVVDVDASARRAVAAGATVERDPADMPYGFRAAGVIDPFGHRWIIQGPLTGTPPTPLERG